MKRFLALALTGVLSIGATATAFAGTDDAYFFGDSEYLTEMEDVEFYMNKMGYGTKIYTDPATSKFTDSRLNSSMLYFAGHGTQKSVNTGENRGICINDRTNFQDVKDTDFSRNEVTILAACQTGNYSDEPTDCLAGTIEDNGANCVLAWISSPHPNVMGDFTERFAYYVYRGNTYIDAVVNTKKYLLSEGLYHDNAIMENVIFGNINDTLPEVQARAAEQAKKNVIDPVSAYIDENLNQKIVEESVIYKDGSSNFDELEQYIQENVDTDFNLSDYSIKEFGEEENGVNLISFRLNVGGVPSDYGFIALCIDDELELITFTNNYEDMTAEEIKAMPVVMADSNDEELFEMAINADGFDYEVDEQRIEKYFDVTEGKIVNAVNTVYIDENGGYFCTENKF